MMEDSTMPRVKQALKRKRMAKAVPALGAAGLTFSLVGGASASVAPINDVPQIPNYSPRHEITLSDEEIADVSLATFYVFDKENAAAAQGSFQLARGGGCGSNPRKRSGHKRQGRPDSVDSSPRCVGDWSQECTNASLH
jgi:hypothetical protein